MPPPKGRPTNNPNGRLKSVTVKLTRAARERFDRQLAEGIDDIFRALFGRDHTITDCRRGASNVILCGRSEEGWWLQLAFGSSPWVRYCRGSSFNCHTPAEVCKSLHQAKCAVAKM